MSERNMAEYRRMKEEIDASTKVSSYLGDVYEALSTGGPVQANVPDHSMGGSIQGPEPIHMDIDNVVGMLEGSVEMPQPAPGNSVPNLQKTASSQMKISQNQHRALQRFPALIEFLGQDDYGDQIAQIVADKLREMVIAKVEANTKLVNKTAQVCIAKNNNIKMYFKTDEYVCCVTASGPFRGDEIIQYNAKDDRSYILRMLDKKRVTDVSDEFQMVREMNTVEEDDA